MRPFLEPLRLAGRGGFPLSPSPPKFLVQVILESEEKETFETTLHRVLREEFQAVPSQPVKPPEEAIPQEMMGFLGSLLGEV